jgi:nucleotide-binding universal stress UspA family protein
MVGYDDSDAAKRALERGIAEARGSHRRLVVLAVAELPLDPNAPRFFGTLDDIPPNEGGELVAPPEIVTTLAHARDRLETAGVPGELAWAAGEPGGAILDAAHSLGAGMIILGEHHHGFLSGFLGTDVAAEVQERAGCDVVVAG